MRDVQKSSLTTMDLGTLPMAPHVRSAGVCQRFCSRLSLATVPAVPMLHFAHLPLLRHA